MFTPPITRWAGSVSLTAAAVLCASQILNLALGLMLGSDSTPMLTHTLKNALALLAQYLLLLALTGLYVHEYRAVGKLGLVGYLTAFLGTLLVAGDWWYEAFVVPQIAAHTPQLFEVAPGGSLLAGAVATFGLFALGWILFGTASLRGRIFPRIPTILVIIGGAVGLFAGTAPYLLPLAVAVGWMGYLLLRPSPTRHDAVAPARRSPATPRDAAAG